MRQDYPRKPTEAGKVHDYERKARHALIRSRIGSTQNARIYQTQQATFVNPVDVSSPGGGEPVTAQAFKIQSVQNDTLTCRTWDQDEDELGETDILVAKDEKLRGAPTRNISVAPTGGGPNVPAVEEVTPAYAVGDIIYALEPEGGTGVDEVTWLDQNTAGRTWMLPLQVVTMCVDNVRYKMVVRGGAPVRA